MVFALFFVVIFAMASTEETLDVMLYLDRAYFHKITTEERVPMSKDEARIHNIWPEDKCKEIRRRKCQQNSSNPVDDVGICNFNEDKEVAENARSLGMNCPTFSHPSRLKIDVWSEREVLHPRFIGLRFMRSVSLENKTLDNRSPFAASWDMGITATVLDIANITTNIKKDEKSKVTYYGGHIDLRISSVEGANVDLNFKHSWGEEQLIYRRRSLEAANSKIVVPSKSSVTIEYITEEWEAEIEISKKFTPSGLIREHGGTGTFKVNQQDCYSEVPEIPVIVKDILKVTYQRNLQVRVL